MQIIQDHKVGNKRSVSIFRDHIRSSAIQKFRDDLPGRRWSKEAEQQVIREPVKGGLTIPLNRSVMKEPSLCVYSFE